MTKQELRKQMRIIRLLTEEKETKSEDILLNLIQHPSYQEAATIALYNSMGDEVDTKGIIQYSLKQGKTVLLPKVQGSDMIFIKVDDHTEYEESSYHIQEPTSNEEYKGSIDLVIVPGLAFTKEGKRLGYGGGYYDRFLNSRKVQTIGICYESQLIEDIPTEDYDKRMNSMITEKQIYTNEIQKNGVIK